jgi:D-cysteine desulfhydrase
MNNNIYDPISYHPPAWASRLTGKPSIRIELAQRPTPLRRWRVPNLPADVELWIKRDDQTGITLSGNKARKLEFLLADALQKGADTVITCGGIQSNHCRATAVAARELGLDAHLLLNHPQPELNPGLAGNLLLDRLVGAQIHLITYEEYQQREPLMQELADRLKTQGRKPYIIPEGGSNGLGSWGYLEAVRELQEQTQKAGIEATDLVFACGSGGTAAGLSLGVKLSGWPVRVHAVNVCLNAEYFHKKVSSIVQSMSAEYRPDDLDIMEGYVGLGYAKSRPQELALMRDVALATGVILDPVYTGKAFFGLWSELAARSSRFRGSKILFVHTGGLFGLYDKLSELAPLFEEPKGGWRYGAH